MQQKTKEHQTKKKIVQGSENKVATKTANLSATKSFKNVQIKMPKSESKKTYQKATQAEYKEHPGTSMSLDTQGTSRRQKREQKQNI